MNISNLFSLNASYGQSKNIINENKFILIVYYKKGIKCENKI